MQIRQVMTRAIEVVRPDATLVEAARDMRERDVGALPVCERDRLIGVVTDRDITVRATAEGLDPRRTEVRDVMTRSVDYVLEDDDVEDAARRMREHQVRRLLVLDRERRLVGLVSLGDLATAMDEGLSGRVLEGVSEDRRGRHADRQTRRGGEAFSLDQGRIQFDRERDREQRRMDWDSSLRDAEQRGRSFFRGREEERGRGFERGYPERPSFARAYGERGWGDVSRGYEGSFGRGEFDRGYGRFEHERGYARGYEPSYGRGEHEGGTFEEMGRSIRETLGEIGDKVRSAFGRGPKGYRRSDERIREDVCERLAERHDLDVSEVTVRVQNGEVVLEGEVADRLQKRLVEQIAETVRGVDDVSNQLRVRRVEVTPGAPQATTAAAGPANGYPTPGAPRTMSNDAGRR